ncbi:MAG: hypothetical protein ISR65_05195 [Bacteriovoracaceae bacterium]|nr:hypothetical protein [Bacteriovoracaceae bacterium]
MTTNKMKESQVLFQKLGDTWYAFTELEQDIVYSALPAGVDPRSTKLDIIEIIDEHMQRVANTRFHQAEGA